MASYVVTPLARADLDGIWDYVSGDNPAAADRLLERFRETFAILASHPSMGEARHELRPGLRSFSVRKYVVYFQVAEERLTIVRVLHGARDVRRLF
jgi:toxin ParE1/3/4